MKKIKVFSIIGILGMLFLCACGKAPEQTNLEQPLEDVMTSIYGNIDEDKLPMMLGAIEITDSNLEGYTGLKTLDFERGLASESMVGSIAHSIVLLRVKANSDIEKIKADIKSNVNPRKWLCVGVDDEENVIVDNIGNTIVLIMNNDIAQELHNNFKSLNKSL